MAQLTVEQRKVIVEEMIKHGSVTTTIRRFQVRYGTRLCKRTVQINYAKWHAHGIVHNLNKENSGPPKTARTETAISTIRNLIYVDKTKTKKRNFKNNNLNKTLYYFLVNVTYFSPLAIMVYKIQHFKIGYFFTKQSVYTNRTNVLKVIV